MRLVVDGWIPNPEFLTELMPKKKKKKRMQILCLHSHEMPMVLKLSRGCL